MTKTKKYYVVWEGKATGIFEHWTTCKSLIDKYQGAKYKSFDSLAEAEKAFAQGYAAYYKSHPSPTRATGLFVPNNTPILDSLAVDAACSGNPGVMEYQGVYTATKEVIFKKGPFPGATNNIGEFLALVHGLALLQKQRSLIPIYSDSITAIAWVRAKQHKTVVLPSKKNEEVFFLLQRATEWLHQNTYPNPILKWQTQEWGEIPADFGRK